MLATCAILIPLSGQWRPIPGFVWHVEGSAARAILHGVSLAGWGLVLYSSFLIDHFVLFGPRRVYLHLRREPYTDAPFKAPWLYRLVRDPLMLGFIIAFWLTPVMTYGHVLFAGVVTGYVFVGIWFEERDIAAKLGIERISVAFVASASLAIIITHGAESLAAGVVTAPESATALPVTVATAALVLACAVSWRVFRSAGRSLAAGVVLSACGAATIAVVQGGFGPAGAAILVVGAAAAYGGRRLAESLPEWLDGATRRRPVACVLWGVLGLATVVQTGRLGTYMADPSFNWWLTTSHTFWTRHECVVAYVYGAELNRRGEPNLYHTSHYPGTNPKAEPRTELKGMTPEDPYQYPPQFLLLPRLAIALTSDFQTIRAVWFMIQIAAFVAIAVLLSRWVGGTRGEVAMLLLPAACISIPALYNFQYGQFHLAAIMLAMGAMLAFERKRNGLGGALLAAATLAKIFPGLLLIPLVLQRRWKALGWTAAFGVGFTLLAWAVIGSAPFAAFFGYQLPRLSSGTAFAFEEAWPELRGLLLLINLAPAAVVRKLGEIGIAGMTETLARVAQSGYTLLVLGAALLAARCRGDRMRLAMSWLALLNLAALASPGAWADFVPASSVWLLTLLAGEAVGRRGLAAVLGFVGAILFFLPGAVPYGTPSAEPVWMMLSVVCTVVLVGLNAVVLLVATAKPRPAAQHGAGGSAGE